MEQLQTVFDYIKEILAIIKKFFEDIFSKKEEEEEGTEGEETVA